VTVPNSPITDTPHTSRAAQIGWGILICVTLYVCYFSHLGAIGFVGPDEPRYAWIARDMMETGDWVTPRLYGRPWFEKPPLFYWGAALSFKLFGVSEAAARLPSAFCALLATLGLAWLALRLYGAETARWLLLLLPTTVGMIGFSHAAATDMPFSGMLTIAMVCAAVVLGLTRSENTPILPRTPWLALLFFGFFLGLAVLAKGPAAIALCGGTVFFWALFTKRWRDALRLLHPAAIASFCLTALPWYVLCARRNPDFFRVFIIEHNFKRYLTPEFQHIQPFWFYGPVLLVAFLPWTALFLWSAVHGAIHLWRTRSTKESTWFLVCWAGFCVIFFSISQSKLPGYVLPTVPAVSLLTSCLCVSNAQTHKRSCRITLLLAAFFFFVLFALAEVIAPHISRGNESFGVTASIVLALLGATNFLFGILLPTSCNGGLRALAAAASVLPFLLALSLTDSLISAYFRWDPSGRTIARQLLVQKIPTERLFVPGMNRGMQYSLSFYLHQEVKTWDVDHPTEGYLLTGGLGCKYWSSRPLACEKLPFDEKATGRFLYRVTIPDSVQRSRSGEHVQKKE
jgi:4-amino-4-deoxy-L-arabinose transferase-like glycosyltransferase